MHFKFICLILIIFGSSVDCEGGRIEDLPECPYHDPIKQADEWRLYHRSTACKITVLKPEEETEEDQRYK